HHLSKHQRNLQRECQRYRHHRLGFIWDPENPRLRNWRWRKADQVCAHRSHGCTNVWRHHGEAVAGNSSEAVRSQPSRFTVWRLIFSACGKHAPAALAIARSMVFLGQQKATKRTKTLFRRNPSDLRNVVATGSPQDESAGCADLWPVCFRRCFFTSGRRSTGPWLQRLRFYLTRSKRSLRCLRFLLFKNPSLHPHHPWVPRSGFNASRFNDLASRSIFPRNEPPNPAKYFSEGPEMTSHDEEPRRPKQQH